MIPDTLFTQPNHYYAIRYDTGYAFRRKDVEPIVLSLNEMDTLATHSNGMVVVNEFGDTLFIESYFPIKAKVDALFPVFEADSISPCQLPAEGNAALTSSFIEYPAPLQPVKVEMESDFIFRFVFAYVMFAVMIYNVYCNMDRWKRLGTDVTYLRKSLFSRNKNAVE